MPELPEVEVLVRHLASALVGRAVREVLVLRPKVAAPSRPLELQQALMGGRFTAVMRRGKYLRFELRLPGRRAPVSLLGHQGMTGRMYVQPAGADRPRHAAVVLRLDRGDFIYEDPRYFGRLTLDLSPLARLGPEPLTKDFTPAGLSVSLGRSRQAIKVKLLDQSLVAGVGNIYASEALFRARISPGRAAHRLKAEEVRQLWRAVRAVLREAIRRGSTMPLSFTGPAGGDRLFYFGRQPDAPAYTRESLWVYDRAGQPCPRCGQDIRRLVQAARSTYFCPGCQR